MGCYIQCPTVKGKAAYLNSRHGADVMLEPEYFSGDYLSVCVVENGQFDAAGVAYNKAEFELFAEDDGRPKTWLKMKSAEVFRVCPMAEDYVNRFK